MEHWSLVDAENLTLRTCGERPGRGQAILEVAPEQLGLSY